MPIRKFHGVEEMPAAPARDASFQRIRDLWALGERLHRPRWPTGVHKNRSIEEANRRRLDWARRKG